MIEKIGRAVYISHMFKGVTGPEAATIIMLKGYELGLGLTASFEFIVPIQGKYELIPRGALALLQNHPLVKRLEVKRVVDDTGVFLGYETTIERTNGFKHTASFMLGDAMRAGLIKPDSGWLKYPENMCLWRSVGFCADVAAPDIISGMTNLLKMPETYQVELDQSGNVIEGTMVEGGTGGMVSSDGNVTENVTKTIPYSNENEAQAVTLEALADKYGGEAVLVANGGKIPATQEELNKIAYELAGAA